MASSYIHTQEPPELLDPRGSEYRVRWTVNPVTKKAKLNGDKAEKTYKITEEIESISVQWWEYGPRVESGTTTVKWRLIDTHTGISKSATFNDYTVSDSALKVSAAIKLNLSKKGKELWTTQYTDYTASNHITVIKGSSLTIPSPPEVSFQDEDTKLRITTTTSDVLAKECQFRVVYERASDSQESVLGYIPSESSYMPLTRLSGPSGEATATATYDISATDGGSYKVQVRYRSDFSTGSYGVSEWSSYGYAGGGSGTDPVVRPGQVTGVSPRMISSTEIYVSWTPITVSIGRVTYIVEWADSENHLGTSFAQSHSGLQQSNDSLSVEAGKTYYIRVKAVVGSQEGAWSRIATVSVALKPDKPSAWTLDNSVKESDTITFYWLHRGKDSSKPTAWTLEYWIRGHESTTKQTRTGSYNLGPDDTDYTKSLTINVMPFAHDGEVIEWHVKTMGVSSAGYSDWSATNYVNIFANPELGISGMADILTEFPYIVTLLARPATQIALSFSVSIFATDTYTTIDNLGNEIIVNNGDEVYHDVFLGVGNEFELVLKPNMLTLENSQTYRLHAVAYMSSGLSAETEGTFSVSLDETAFEINAGFVYDIKTLSAAIYPRAVIYPLEGEEYEEILVDNTLMSVYRINHDGSFIELATGLTNDGATVVVDPHPALRNATYRVIATNMLTGSMYYDDYRASKDDFYFASIVLQWDGTYRELGYFEENESNLILGRLYTGKTLLLPGNTKISEGSVKDVEHAEYIGREHPVSYFGTQKGSQATWYGEFPREDLETIELIRKLDYWSGNVYVREPYGSGYWATVDVSYNLDYDNLVVPVSLQIKRIESKEP